ncbi:hypothetical protein pdam_00005728, partial [Pocillopora damicornis]
SLGTNHTHVESNPRWRLKILGKCYATIPKDVLKRLLPFNTPDMIINSPLQLLYISLEKQMTAAFQQEAGQSDYGRSSLLATDLRGRDTNPFDEPEPDSNVSIDDMRRQQQQIIADIIDDIDARMDQTNQRLIRETTHVRKVTAKSSTCGMLVVIVLLIIAIIVVAVVPTH